MQDAEDRQAEIAETARRLDHLQSRLAETEQQRCSAHDKNAAAKTAAESFRQQKVLSQKQDADKHVQMLAEWLAGRNSKAEAAARDLAKEKAKWRNAQKEAEEAVVVVVILTVYSTILIFLFGLLMWKKLS